MRKESPEQTLSDIIAKGVEKALTPEIRDMVFTEALKNFDIEKYQALLQRIVSDSNQESNWKKGQIQELRTELIMIAAFHELGDLSDDYKAFRTVFQAALSKPPQTPFS